MTQNELKQGGTIKCVAQLELQLTNGGCSIAAGAYNDAVLADIKKAIEAASDV